MFLVLFSFCPTYLLIELNRGENKGRTKKKRAKEVGERIAREEVSVYDFPKG